MVHEGRVLILPPSLVNALPTRVPFNLMSGIALRETAITVKPAAIPEGSHKAALRIDASWGVAMHAFNSTTQKAEVGGSLCLKQQQNCCWPSVLIISLQGCSLLAL